MTQSNTKENVLKFGRVVFSEVRYMLLPVRLSFVCLSVTLVHPTQPVEIFGNFSMHMVPWPSFDIQENFTKIGAGKLLRRRV